MARLITCDFCGASIPDDECCYMGKKAYCCPSHAQADAGIVPELPVSEYEDLLSYLDLCLAGQSVVVQHGPGEYTHYFGPWEPVVLGAPKTERDLNCSDCIFQADACNAAHRGRGCDDLVTYLDPEKKGDSNA